MILKSIQSWVEPVRIFRAKPRLPLLLIFGSYPAALFVPPDRLTSGIGPGKLYRTGDRCIESSILVTG